MQNFTNIYYLKADTKVSDIYDCIRAIFNEYGLPVDVPKNYSLETHTQSILWNYPSEDDGLVEFSFYDTAPDSPKSKLRIVFAKKIQNNMHLLFFQEILEHSGFIYTERFLSLIKKCIPKSCIHTKLIDDKLALQKAFHEYVLKIKSSQPLDFDDAIEAALRDFLLSIVEPETFGTT